jgi:hypothetical protein
VKVLDSILNVLHKIQIIEKLNSTFRRSHDEKKTIFLTYVLVYIINYRAYLQKQENE